MAIWQDGKHSQMKKILVRTPLTFLLLDLCIYLNSRGILQALYRQGFRSCSVRS